MKLGRLRKIVLFFHNDSMRPMPAGTLVRPTEQSTTTVLMLVPLRCPGWDRALSANEVEGSVRWLSPLEILALAETLP